MISQLETFFDIMNNQGSRYWIETDHDIDLLQSITTNLDPVSPELKKVVEIINQIRIAKKVENRVKNGLKKLAPDIFNICQEALTYYKEYKKDPSSLIDEQFEKIKISKVYHELNN